MMKDGSDGQAGQARQTRHSKLVDVLTYITGLYRTNRRPVARKTLKVLIVRNGSTEDKIISILE